MILVLAAAIAAIAFSVYWRRRNKRPDAQRESTPALDSWVVETLELELAEAVFEMRASTADERKSLRKSLDGDPDPTVVSKIEDAVKTVELEYTRYAHESDAEITLHVRYENGKEFTSKRRMPWADMPPAIRSDFEERGSTRSFRTWTFPWSRVVAL